MTDAEAIAALEKLYASLPQVQCKGLCWNSCGPIDMSTVERRRIEAAGVVFPEFGHRQAQRWARGEQLRCPALDDEFRCTVYEIRPMVCRLWGLARGELACPHGCQLTGPRMRLPQALRLLRASFIIGGDEKGWAAIDPRLFDDIDVARWFSVLMTGDEDAIPPLQQAVRRAAKRLGIHAGEH